VFWRFVRVGTGRNWKVRLFEVKLTKCPEIRVWVFVVINNVQYISEIN